MINQNNRCHLVQQCVTIVQQRMRHFPTKADHSAKLVKQKKAKNSIMLYNSVCDTFTTLKDIV